MDRTIGMMLKKKKKKKKIIAFFYNLSFLMIKLFAFDGFLFFLFFHFLWLNVKGEADAIHLPVLFIIQWTNMLRL